MHGVSIYLRFREQRSYNLQSTSCSSLSFILLPTLTPSDVLTCAMLSEYQIMSLSLELKILWSICSSCKKNRIRIYVHTVLGTSENTPSDPILSMACVLKKLTCLLTLSSSSTHCAHAFGIPSVDDRCKWQIEYRVQF